MFNIFRTCPLNSFAIIKKVHEKPLDLQKNVGQHCNFSVHVYVSKFDETVCVLTDTGWAQFFKASLGLLKVLVMLQSIQ